MTDELISGEDERAFSVDVYIAYKIRNRLADVTLDIHNFMFPKHLDANKMTKPKT